MTQNEKTGYLTLKRAVYGQYSRSYDEDRDRFVSGSALAQRIDWALEPLRPGGRLLDLGCGSGQLLHRAVDHTGCEAMLTGFDLTPDMLALARAGLSGSVNLVEGDATAGRPFGDESFDLITSLNLVQELPTNSVPDVLTDIYRLLRPDGIFRAVIPCMADGMTDNNESADMFRRLAQDRGAMDFRYAGDLDELLLGARGFTDKLTKFLLSPAAANAAKGESRFTLFTNILKDIANAGLDPGQVQQGVIFFSGQRQPGS